MSDAASIHVFGRGPASGATSYWWSCSCGSLGGGWPNHALAQREADAHLEKHKATPADDSAEFYEGTLMDGLEDDPAAAPSLARLRELKHAEAAFLVASVAVWREIDERDARPGGYSAAVLTKDTDLRVAERATWNRYRKALDALA